MENEIKSLIKELNTASFAYYNGNEIMSNFEWDEKFDKLRALEEETGIIFDNSPTKNVGSAPKVGNRVAHAYPAKSLDKTKDVGQLQSKMTGEKELLLMWKLDGGTLQLTYENGRLKIAATRGNGEIGQDITANAPYILGIPLNIDYKGSLTVRGEALMSYADFERINENLPENEQYANPRNLANATVSMLDVNEVKIRTIHFKAFGIVDMQDNEPELFSGRLEWLLKQGFECVEWEVVSPMDLPNAIENWTKKVESFPFPVDGLVVASNDISRCEKLPGTGHHPNVLSGYAFKWADTLATTVLKEIEWSPSRTGLLNPVAIFENVDLEGTSVSRASLHNFSYLRQKHLRIGDEISVYKANMVIPQILENLSENTSEFSDDEINKMIPNCPVCGNLASIRNLNGIETMHCENDNCIAKKIGAFVHFCERDAMDIEGMSEATITKFVEKGFLHSLSDIYKLDKYRDEIVAMEGFGNKSWENLKLAIDNSKNREITAFLSAIGIPNIGKGQARLIAVHFKGSAKETLEKVFALGGNQYDFSVIDGIGNVINESIHDFAVNASKEDSFLGDILLQLSLQDIKVAGNSDSPVAGKTFVVTGAVNNFANRDELKAKIEGLGGKVTGSVTSKTDYLINNDITSTSGKNKKAKDLNIPIISEEDFLKMIQEEG